MNLIHAKTLHEAVKIRTILVFAAMYKATDLHEYIYWTNDHKKNVYIAKQVMNFIES